MSISTKKFIKVGIIQNIQSMTVNYNNNLFILHYSFVYFYQRNGGKLSLLNIRLEQIHDKVKKSSVDVVLSRLANCSITDNETAFRNIHHVLKDVGSWLPFVPCVKLHFIFYHLEWSLLFLGPYSKWKLDDSNRSICCSTTHFQLLYRL